MTSRIWANPIVLCVNGSNGAPLLPFVKPQNDTKMKLLNSGQLSYQKVIARIFLAALFLTSFTANHASGLPIDFPPLESQSQWSGSAELATSSYSQEDITVQLFLSTSDFSCQANLNSDGSSLTVTLTSSAGSVTPGQDVAIVTIGDPNDPGYQEFLVQVDGGGIILVVDEF